MRMLVSAFALCAALAGPALAEQQSFTVLESDARIASTRSIQDFDLAADGSVLVRAAGNAWYRMVPDQSCAADLDYSPDLAIENASRSGLDRLSRITVSGRPCPIHSLDR